MPNKTMMTVTVAVAISLAVGVPIGFYAMHVHDDMQKRSRVVLLVAREDYPAYTSINDVKAMFEEKEIPLLEAPQDAVSPSSPPSKTRNCLRKPLKKGEVLVYSNLERPDLDMVLAPGSRAVSIRMDAAPELLPGMRCDLLHKERRDGKDQEAKVLLTGVLLHSINRAAGSKQVRSTFELAPDQVLTLLAARESGTILLQPR